MKKNWNVILWNIKIYSSPSYFVDLNKLVMYSHKFKVPFVNNSNKKNWNNRWENTLFIVTRMFCGSMDSFEEAVVSRLWIILSGVIHDARNKIVDRFKVLWTF